MNACQRNDKLLRQLIADGASLTEIAKQVGTNRRHVRAYIAQNNIPHEPFLVSGPGAKNGRWRGGRIIDKDGYVLVKSYNHPNRDRHDYVREHRLVMENKLGRYLLPSEVVHHIDGNKQNNHPDNLEAFQRNSEHLAKTLKGKQPNWTTDGIQRILAGIQKSVAVRRKPSRG